MSSSPTAIVTSPMWSSLRSTVNERSVAEIVNVVLPSKSDAVATETVMEPVTVTCTAAAAAGSVDSGNGPAVECTTSGTVDGTWLLVRAYGPTDQVSASGVDALYAAAAARLGEQPRATPATRTAQWWSQPDCPALAAQVDPGVYGYERVTQLEPTTSDPGAQPEAIVSLAGAAFACELHFTSGSGDTSAGEVVRIDIVPGGALTFPTAVAAQGAGAVTVSGAQAAVIVPGLDRYEGSGEVIVATDGVNMLMVTPDIVRDPAEAVPLAEVVFAAMRP